MQSKYKKTYNFFKNWAGKKTKGIFPPFFSDLLTWHYKRKQSTWQEYFDSLNANILPLVGSSNGTSEKLCWTTPLINDLTEWTVAFRFNNYQDLVATFNFVCGGLSFKNLMFKSIANVAYRAADNVYYKWDGLGNTASVTSTSLKNAYHSILWRSDGTNIYLILDGVDKGYITPTSTNLVFDCFMLGYSSDIYGTDGNFWDLKTFTSDIGQTEALLYHNNNMTVTPQNWYPDVYSGTDVVGGNQANIDNLSKAYDDNKSFYKLNYGFQNFNTAADGSGSTLQVPYQSDGTKTYNISIGATQIIRSVTYYFISDHPPSAKYLNMSDCLIDFDPDDTTDSKLDNFDRSNTTIYNADARSGIDYDASNPYRFQINNLDPRILFDWRNVGYKGTLFAKIVLDSNKNLVRIDEILNYETDKTDANEYKVMLYCGYRNIIIVDENGDYLIDANDYVIIENL